MGPLLWRDNYSLYYPGDPNSEVVPNYYASEYTAKDSDTESVDGKSSEKPVGNQASDEIISKDSNEEEQQHSPKSHDRAQKEQHVDLAAIDQLPWFYPQRLWATTRYVVMYGITRDIIGHQSKGLEDVHARAPQFDNKVEHLCKSNHWSTGSLSALSSEDKRPMMSLASSASFFSSSSAC